MPTIRSPARFPPTVNVARGPDTATLAAGDDLPPHDPARVVGRDLVSQVDTTLVSQPQFARRLRQLSLEHATHVDAHAGGRRRGEVAAAVDAVVLAVDREHVVRPGVQAKHLPAIAGGLPVPDLQAERLEGVVVLHPEVFDETLTQHVDDEGAHVHVAVR